MLGIGIICVVYLLWQTTANLSLITGYLAIVLCFLYADYLDSRGRTDSPGLTWYYQNSSIFYYLALVLVLPALSWFVLAPSVNIQLVPWYGMYAGVLSYVTYKEYKGVSDESASPKQRKRNAGISDFINRWYFVLIIIIFSITSLIMLYTPGGMGISGSRYSPPFGFLRGFLPVCTNASFWWCRCVGTHFHFILYSHVPVHTAPWYPATGFSVIFCPDQCPAAESCSPDMASLS